MVNMIILVVMISSIILIVYLLGNKKIGSNQFTRLFVCIMLVSLGFYCSDRLKEIDLAKMRIIFEQVKEIRKDIYAKAETVRRIGEDLADLTVFNVTHVGRFASPDLQEKMLETKGKVKVLLQKIGSDESKIESIIAPINRTVLGDIKNEAVGKVENITYKMSQNNQLDSKQREEIITETRNQLENYDRDQLIYYFKIKGIDQETVLPILDRVDKFIKNKNF